MYFVFRGQSHHHNGDQARPLDDPQMMCSICCRQFATNRFGVRGGWGRAHTVARPHVPISSLLAFLSYLAGSKSVSVRRLPTCPTWMRQKATVSSSGKSTFEHRLMFSATAKHI